MRVGIQDAPNFLFQGVRLNTRFNPTTNGRLHIGHLYLVILNAEYAHRTGGKFQVRFDDNQAAWVGRIGEAAMDRHAEQMRRDVEWCGVEVDEWVSQRALEGEVRGRLAAWGHVPVRFPHPHRTPHAARYFYSYTPYETLEKVVLDWVTTCNCIIRADDLVSEFSLYYYFCQTLGLAHPDLIYVPRMREEETRGEIGDGVSKTRGGYALADYRTAGWEPAQVRDLAAESALIDPALGWRLENVRELPQVAYSVEDLARWEEDHA